MYRESQHYLALIRFPTLWGLLYRALGFGFRVRVEGCRVQGVGALHGGVPGFMLGPYESETAFLIESYRDVVIL